MDRGTQWCHGLAVGPQRVCPCSGTWFFHLESQNVSFHPHEAVDRPQGQAIDARLRAQLLCKAELMALLGIMLLGMAYAPGIRGGLLAHTGPITVPSPASYIRSDWMKGKSCDPSHTYGNASLGFLKRKREMAPLLSLERDLEVRATGPGWGPAGWEGSPWSEVATGLGRDPAPEPASSCGPRATLRAQEVSPTPS